MVIGMPLKMLIGLLFFMSLLPFIVNMIKDIIYQLSDVLQGTLVYQGSIISLIHTLY